LIAAVGPAEELDETVAPFPSVRPQRAVARRTLGSAPFTEADADDFFGREAEVVALWRKIADRRCWR